MIVTDRIAAERVTLLVEANDGFALPHAVHRLEEVAHRHVAVERFPLADQSFRRERQRFDFLDGLVGNGQRAEQCKPRPRQMRTPRSATENRSFESSLSGKPRS